MPARRRAAKSLRAAGSDRVLVGRNAVKLFGDRSERIGQRSVRTRIVERPAAIGKEFRQQRHAAGVKRTLSPQARREGEQTGSRFEDLAPRERNGDRTRTWWALRKAHEAFEARGEPITCAA